MTAKNYSPIKFLWATTGFVLFMFIFIGLVMVYLQRPQTKLVNSTSQQPVSPLVPTASREATPYAKNYQSKYSWKVIYPGEATVDTSIEKSSPSLERVTLSQLDSTQPAIGKGFNGYSFDISVESKTGSLSNFADRDSLRIASGKREFFTTTKISGKTGYKVLTKDTQEYLTYYLPLKDPNLVLIVTTSTGGSNKDTWDESVNRILGSLELLD